MARYLLEQPHFLGDKYFPAGATVDWNGPPSKEMTPVEEVARQRKAEYDATRPHFRPSRDILPKASVVHDPMARRPGMPRVAGPPGQEPAPSADPANPERTIEIAAERKEFEKQDAALREEALVQPEAAPDDDEPKRSTRHKK